MSDFRDVGALADLAAGEQRSLMLGTTKLLICHDASAGRVWAVQDRCPHAFQSLAGGTVRNGTLQCPKHGACFDLATGRATNEVTTRSLQVHATRVEDGRILVSPMPLPSS